MKRQVKEHVSTKTYVPSYKKQATYYDAIYESQGKDYQKEARRIHEIIEQYKRSGSNNLLDVACGTGGHFPYLVKWYAVEGIDLDEDMLKVARERFPEGAFHQGDMADFQLGKEYDVITCLFSAIGYARTPEGMNKAIKNMSQHLAEGGMLIIEPWFTPEEWRVGDPRATFVDRPDLKIARVNISKRQGNIAIVNFHFLVGTKSGVEYFTELHELGLFTEGEYLAAIEGAGLDTARDAEGLTGRGLYIGVKP
jgi:SAM-dependent methyltransferase